jgi:hypothetical protein
LRTLLFEQGEKSIQAILIALKDLQKRASCDAAFSVALNEAIFSFHCVQDRDIETFLHEKAFEFEERRLCATYLLLEEEAFFDGRLKIEAYFTLSHKSLVADPETMSRSTVKKYGGFVTARTLDFVLIGQLGKYISDTERSPLSGRYILDVAFEVIQEASDLIPCKHVLIECSNDEKVKRFYEENQFRFFQHDGEHNQYCKKI